LRAGWLGAHSGVTHPAVERPGPETDAMDSTSQILLVVLMVIYVFCQYRRYQKPIHELVSALVERVETHRRERIRQAFIEYQAKAETE